MLIGATTTLKQRSVRLKQRLSLLGSKDLLNAGKKRYLTQKSRILLTTKKSIVLTPPLILCMIKYMRYLNKEGTHQGCQRQYSTTKWGNDVNTMNSMVSLLS